MAIKIAGTTVIDDNRKADVVDITLGGTLVTATSAELNTLDGITSTTAELNYTDGVTSPIQTQINSINFKSYFKGQL